MDENSENQTLTDEKEKQKKKRPSLAIYQPPANRSRNRGSNTEAAAKVADEKQKPLQKTQQKQVESNRRVTVHKSEAKTDDSKPSNESTSFSAASNDSKLLKIKETVKQPVAEESPNPTNQIKPQPKIPATVPKTAIAMNRPVKKIDDPKPIQAVTVEINKEPVSIAKSTEEITPTPNCIQNIAKSGSIESNESLNVKTVRGGVLKINLEDIENASNKQNERDREKTPVDLKDPKMKYKVLFDPYNPTTPIYVPDKSASGVKQDEQRYTPSQKQQQLPKAPQLPPQTPEKMQLNEIKIQKIEQHLKHTIDTCNYTQYSQHLDAVNNLRKQYETVYLESIQVNIELTMNLNLDLNFWKLNYHHIIENLRKEFNQTGNATIKVYLDSYINDGFNFYKNFLLKLESLFQFNYEKQFKSTCVFLPHLLPVHQQTKVFKSVLLCVHRLLICFGDLARYRELCSVDVCSKDYSLARSYYLQAQKIIPKSSRSYNQLAILALYTRRRLDAVYYYTRCLELNSPLLTARQSLISLFDDARKRSEHLSENLNAKKSAVKKTSVATATRVASNRVEMWFRPNEVDAKKRTASFTLHSDSDREDDTDEDGDDVKLSHLSTIELNKRFMHDYLNTIGKLFTKVGMESYADVCSRMLHEFAELLKREPCPFGRMRLLQLTLVNISIINQIQFTKQQQQRPPGSHGLSFNEEYGEEDRVMTSPLVLVQRSQLQENAIQLGLDMFALVLRRLTSMIQSVEFRLDTMDTPIRDLYTSVKVYIDWMFVNCALWWPLPDQLPPDLGPNFDFVQLLVNFFNCLLKIDYGNTGMGRMVADGARVVNVLLDEDMETNGFLPFVKLNLDFIAVTVAEHENECEAVARSKDVKRIQKSLEFANFLCSLKMPWIKYDAHNNLYLSNTKSSTAQKPVDQSRRISEKLDDSLNSTQSDSLLENDGVCTSDGALIDENDRSLSDLLEKRKLLKAKLDEKLKREKSVQSYVDSSSTRRIELEIRPRFLVPDTNCFINNLKLVENLLKTTRYIVVIPLLVINELDKLSKSISNYNDDSVEHAEMVQRNAKLSMIYLNERFDNRERNIKAITSQGSILETIQFRTEEFKAQGSNDDLILECCLHYCHDNARDYMPHNKNDPIHLFREVVLLTDDRNLRLKAHTRNVPVKNILNFCKWANVSLK